MLEARQTPEVEIKNKFDITENLIDGIMNRSPVVGGPLHDTVEFTVESGWRINESVNMSRFITRTCVNEEVQGAVVVRLKCVEEMISTAEVAKPAFVAPKQLGNTIPSSKVQFRRRDVGSQQPHPTPAIGNREFPPIVLACEYGCAGRQRRFARTRIGKKDDQLSFKIMWNP